MTVKPTDMGRVNKPFPYAGEDTRPCKYCGVLIYFYRTRKGKLVPVEAVSKEAHWKSCPGDPKTRKPR